MKKAILEYKITKTDAGKSAEDICKKRLGISAKLLTTLKLSGKLTINDNICRSIDKVQENDIFKADVTDYGTSEKIVKSYCPIEILYDDEYMTIVNKPRKMSIHPSIGHFEDTLANAVVGFWERNNETHKFHAVNRLDKDTSGICIIAKNTFAHNHLSVQSKNGELTKKYLAVVDGTPHSESGTIDAPIKRTGFSAIKRMVADDGKNAITHYRTIKTSSSYSLCEIWLETGRTHQIRVHFAYMGNPLMGDWLYNEKHIKGTNDGQLLHVHQISLTHPATHKKMEFTAPLPMDMQTLF